MSDDKHHESHVIFVTQFLNIVWFST